MCTQKKLFAKNFCKLQVSSKEEDKLQFCTLYFLNTWGQVFLLWWSRREVWAHGWRDHVSLSGCVMLTAWPFTGRLTCLTPWQTILHYQPNQAHAQYQSGTGGSTVEKPAESLRLVSAPNSRSPGHDFESPGTGKLKVERPLGSGLSKRHPYIFLQSGASAYVLVCKLF